MNTIQPFNPYGCFPDKLIFCLQIIGVLIALFFCFFLPDPVGVMGLIVHYQDVLLAAYLPAQYTFHPLRITLHVSERLHLHFFEIALLIPFFAHYF